MQFALIGCNDESLRIVSAIARSELHAVSTIYNADHERRTLFDLVPHARWEEHWESLLVEGEVDAVIATAHEDRALFEEQLRKLVQETVPLIVIHPLHDALFAYELEMIRESAAGVIVPFFSEINHPAFDRAAALIAAGDGSMIGRVEQLVRDRYLAHRDRAAVLSALGRDLTTLRQLLGDITSVNAVAGGTDENSLGNLSVSLSNSSGQVARWSVSPPSGVDNACLTLIGTRGKAIVTFSHGDQTAQLHVESPDQSSVESFSGYDAGTAVLDQLEIALASPRVSSWEPICHDLDTCEQALRSLRRKRTIELRRDAQNEEGAFKGIMAAGGCLVLLLATLLLFAFSAFDMIRMPLLDPEALQADQPVDRGSRWLRLWPVYPLLAFLLLQLLLLVTKKASRKDAAK